MSENKWLFKKLNVLRALSPVHIRFWAFKYNWYAYLKRKKLFYTILHKI